jgi:hypothetical protein
MTSIECCPMPTSILSLLDVEYHELTVIEYYGKRRQNRSTRHHWICECRCGAYIIVEGSHLKEGHTRSCGCLQKKVVSKLNKTHGLAKTPEYKIWHAMIRRCTNKDLECYKNYGGRGITVCERWLNSIQLFLEDMGPRPSPDLSVERIDNAGNYCPENCKWGTDEEQLNNKRDNVVLTYRDETMTVAQWARKFNVKSNRIYQAIYKGRSATDILDKIQQEQDAKKHETNAASVAL